MHTTLAHLQVNIRGENLPFYRELVAALGWATLYEDETMLGASGANNASLRFVAAANESRNDYDGPGVNHLAIGASSRAEVDEAAAWLAARDVAALFDTPRHRPEFAADEDSTYYQVMFESPDRLLFEVVYTGPRER